MGVWLPDDTAVAVHHWRGDAGNIQAQRLVLALLTSQASGHWHRCLQRSATARAVGLMRKVMNDYR